MLFWNILYLTKSVALKFNLWFKFLVSFFFFLLVAVLCYGNTLLSTHH